MRQAVSVFGSTGSIGTQTLQVVQAFSERFYIDVLAAGRNIDLLVKQIQQFRPRLVVVADDESAAILKDRVDGSIDIAVGVAGLEEAAVSTEAPTIVMAVVGAVGLKPTLAALRAGKTVALANKETLVAAGELVMNEVRQGSGTIIPVDSEHSAIFQALQGEKTADVHRLILTASGGPFRQTPLNHMQHIRSADALKHPTWQMGGKITIDSATLMNKGLEVIEAHHLFGMDYDAIDVLVHPQSIVHSIVEYVDGSMIAQMGTADMRTPIQYALFYPERILTPWPRLDLTDTSLTFEKPDFTRFPALALAYEAGRIGKTAPAVLNAANEVAVQAFIDEKIPFLGIPQCVESVLAAHNVHSVDSLETVLAADAWARREANLVLRKLTS